MSNQTKDIEVFLNQHSVQLTVHYKAGGTNPASIPIRSFIDLIAKELENRK